MYIKLSWALQCNSNNNNEDDDDDGDDDDKLIWELVVVTLLNFDLDFAIYSWLAQSHN